MFRRRRRKKSKSPPPDRSRPLAESLSRTRSPNLSERIGLLEKAQASHKREKPLIGSQPLVMPLSSRRSYEVRDEEEEEEDSNWAFMSDKTTDYVDRVEKENADLSSWVINWGRSSTTTTKGAREHPVTGEPHNSTNRNEQSKRNLSQGRSSYGGADQFSRSYPYSAPSADKSEGSNDVRSAQSIFTLERRNDDEKQLLNPLNSWSSSTPSSNAVSAFLRELWEETISSESSSESSSFLETFSQKRSISSKQDPPVYEDMHTEVSEGVSNDGEFSAKPSTPWPWRRRKNEYGTTGVGRLGITERIDVFDHKSGYGQCTQTYGDSKPKTRSFDRGQKDSGKKAEIGKQYDDSKEAPASRRKNARSKQTKTFGLSLGGLSAEADVGAGRCQENLPGIPRIVSSRQVIEEQDEDVVFQKSVPIRAHERMESRGDPSRQQRDSFVTYEEILKTLRKKQPSESKYIEASICDESDFYQSEEGSKVSNVCKSELVGEYLSTPQQQRSKDSKLEALTYGKSDFQSSKDQRQQRFNAVKEPESSILKVSPNTNQLHGMQETVAKEGLRPKSRRTDQAYSTPYKQEQGCEGSDCYQAENGGSEIKIESTKMPRYSTLKGTDESNRSHNNGDEHCVPAARRLIQANTLKASRDSTLNRTTESTKSCNANDDDDHDRITPRIDYVVHGKSLSRGQLKANTEKDDTPGQRSIQESVSLFDDIGDEESSGASTRALHDGLSSFDPTPSGGTPVAADNVRRSVEEVLEQGENEKTTNYQQTSDYIPARPQQSSPYVLPHETDASVPVFDVNDQGYYSNHSYNAQNMAALDEFRRKHFPTLFQHPTRYPIPTSYNHEPSVTNKYVYGAAGVPGYPSYQPNLRHPHYHYQSDSMRDYWETYASVQPLGSFDSVSVVNGQPGPIAAAPGNDFYGNVYTSGYHPPDQIHPQYDEPRYPHPHHPLQHEGVFYEPMGIPQAPSNDSSTRRKVDESTAPFSPNERTIETVSTFSTIKKRKAAHVQSRKSVRDDAETLVTDADDESQAGGHGCSLICGDYSFGVKGWLCP